MVCRKIFMPNNNMYSVSKIYANGKYIYSLKKYMLIKTTFDVSKNIC